jgi:hypothetical protein
MPDRDSDAEKAYRAQGEAECRRIAEIIRAELPKNRGFILVTADYGGGGEPFSNTHYVAGVKRQDAQRLLTELLDYWGAEQGLACEPSVRTATALREGVFTIRSSGAEPLRILQNARRNVRDAESAVQLKDARTAKIELLKAATELLTVFDQLMWKEERNAED